MVEVKRCRICLYNVSGPAPPCPQDEPGMGIEESMSKNVWVKGGPCDAFVRYTRKGAEAYAEEWAGKAEKKWFEAMFPGREYIPRRQEAWPTIGVRKIEKPAPKPVRRSTCKLGEGRIEALKLWLARNGGRAEDAQVKEQGEEEEKN